MATASDAKATSEILGGNPVAAAKTSQDLFAGSAIPENLATLQAAVNEIGKK